MSDDEDRSSASGSGSGSGSGSESEDLTTTGLVATRAKRRTAGNLYETLRANLDDEELQKELLAEDEADDAEDYEGSERGGGGDGDGDGDEDDDDDDAMDSSSEDDDDDAAAAAADGLEGEKELKRVERAELRRRRKAHEARLKLPVWHKKRKRVTLAADAKTEDGGGGGSGEGATAVAEESARPAKKKKSERSNWLPGPAELPTRQSVRSLAVANREVVHANLKQSAARSERQRATMKHAARKEKASKRADLTLEQRLERCRRIEKETAKELGRFEREEAERVRLREEALAAKRKRGFDGPVVRTLSVSGMYEDGKLRVKRLLHGSQDLEAFAEAQRVAREKVSLQAAVHEDDLGCVDGTLTAAKVHDHNEAAVPMDVGGTVRMDVQGAVQTDVEGSKTASTSTHDPAIPIEPDTDIHAGAPKQPAESSVDQGQAPVSWLAGIHDYASLPTDPAPQAQLPLPYTPSAPDLNRLPSSWPQALPQPQTVAPDAPPAATTLPGSHQVEPFTNTSWPPGTRAFHLDSPNDPPQQPTPVLREQAQRTLIILESFHSLEATTSTKRSKWTSSLEPTPVAQILLPDSYPTFKEEEANYLRKARKQKQDPLSRPRCALTTWQGRYRDPKTGIVYADVAAYKMLQRIIAGGCSWSGQLECWVGPAYGRMGRAARGVPEGFERPLVGEAAGKKAPVEGQ